MGSIYFFSYAAYLQDTGTRVTFSENFSSIRSVLSSPLAANEKEQQEQQEDETNMHPHIYSKAPPWDSKRGRF